MNLHHLRVFEAVVKAGNFSRAGKSLRISQPAVSKQLLLLERHFGAQLLDRHPKGARLTAAGKRLAGFSHRLFAIEAEAEQSLAELQGLRSGRLTVGASTTIGIYYLPGLLARYRRMYPSIDLNLEVANTRVIQESMNQRRVDIALTEGFVHLPELQAQAFLTDELVPVVPIGHELAGHRGCSLSRFCTEPLLMREAGSGTREVIEAALARNGIEIRPLMTLGSTEAIKRSVAAGVGVSFVSRLTVRQELADRRLATVSIKGFRLKRSLHLVQARDQSISAAVRAFLDLLEQTAGETSDYP